MATIVLFNKPFGVICQFSRDGERRTLGDFLHEPGVYPAGRLDADSEGLVVLTADGALQHEISAPRAKLPKIYCVQVEGIASEPAADRLRSGVRLPDYTTRPAKARLIDEPAWLWPRDPPIRARRAIPTSWIELTLTEGKNRQVRRMTAAVGLPTLRLIRYAVGIWTLSDLEPGAWRAIDVPRAPAVHSQGRGGERAASTARRNRR